MWFRSSLHSDPLRRSCLFSLATREKKPLLHRVGALPGKKKRRQRKTSARRLNLVEEKTGYALYPNFLHMLLHKFYVPFLFTSDDYVVLRFVGDNNIDRSWPRCGVLDILFLNGEKT